MQLFSKTYRLFYTMLLGMLFLSTTQMMGQATGYKYKKQITIQSSQVAATLTNFPVLISITDTNLRDNVQNANGYDIVFTSDVAGNNVLNHQIESYNASTGNLVAWVKIPSLSGSVNTSIYMFYDKTGVTANPSSNTTWSSQYSSVYHFQNNLIDATGTANNGMNHNSTNITAGKIGNARQFNGTSAYVEVSQDLSQVLGGNGTVTAWIKTNQTGNNTVWLAPGLTGIEESGGANDIFYGHINGAGKFGITAGNGNTAYSTNAVNNNQWHYVVFTRNTGNGQVRTYVDGTLNNTATSNTGNKTNAFHSIGRIEDTGGSPEYYNGTIDEFRVSNQIFSQNTIQTSYNNQNNPATFYTLGTPQFIGGADLSITNNDSNDPVYTGALFTYSLQVSNNGLQTATGVTLSDNLPAGVTYQSVTTSQGSCTGSSTLSCNLGSLANGQTAQVDITVKANSAGSASNTASVTANEDDPNSGNNSDTETTTISSVGSYRCYAVAGEGGGGNNGDRLDFINTQNNTIQTKGFTGTQSIKANAYNSATGVMYAANGNRLGTVNLNSGTFSALPNTFGTAGGSVGNVNLNNVVGLAYLSDSGTMVGIHQRNGQELAFVINLSTGQHVPNVFGNNVDYIAINDPNGFANLNDIAFANSFLYAIVNNTSKQNDRLIRINTSNFNIIDVGRITQNGNGINNVEGLGISGNGNLVATTNSNEAIYLINPNNATATLITNLPGNDYEAVDCISTAANRSADLKITKTVNDATPDVGSTITYTIKAQNLGPDLATYVQVADQLPSGITFVSSNASQGSYDTANNNWFVGNLNSGNTATLTIQATVNSGTGGTTITNTASVDYTGQNDSQNGNNSASVNINPQIPDNTAPDAPENMSATAIVGGDIEVSFDDVDEASGTGVNSYSVKRSTSQGSGYTEVGTVTDNESASYTYTDNTVTDGTIYYYVVTAIDAASNESTNSTEVSATADATAPALQTASVSGTALQLDYDETLNSGSVPAPGDFNIQVNGSARTVTNVAITGDKVNLTLSSAVVYGDNVTGSYTAGANPVQDAVGNESSNLSAQTVTNNTPDGAAPGAPQNVSATALIGGNISIFFDDVDETGSGVNSYSVKRSATQGGPYTEVSTITDNESASYTYTDNTATDGTTYYYVVTAIDGSTNESTNSAEVSATADGTSPTLQTATVSNAALQLDYDETLDSGSVPATSDYTVSVNGSPRSVTNVAINGDKVNLTLSSAVGPSDTITLNYTAGTNPVRDVVGNDAANVSNQSVTNNSDNTPPTLTAATVNGNSLKLSYSETLSTGFVPAPSDYTVRVNGTARTITGVQINSNKVNLTLDPAVVSGDNVQFDYAAGTNPLQDPAGNNAANLSNQPVTNNTYNNTPFGPDPCPINNGQDAAWACFDGANGGTSMSAKVGNLQIATVDAASGSQTTFAPNAIQQWASGDFSGDEYNGPQANPGGNSGNATSFDITIPNGVPSDALILALNRLRPDGGGTSYTLEAFDASNNKITINDWLTGQGTDGGVCTNSVNLNYTNGNTTIEFQPTVSGNPSCSSSSTPIWFRITDANVARIEIRKTAAQPDNIYVGLALVADFGDAPNVYNTRYNSRANPPAFHLLSNTGTNPVYFGSGVDGDGNGRSNTAATGDDNDSGLDSGDDEDGISTLPVLTTADTQYSVTLSCTTGANVAGWIDFDQSGTFDFGESASATCSSGSVTLVWTGLSGLTTGQTYARFRIATSAADVAEPQGSAADGEVEDYALNIIDAPQPDLELTKTVDNSTPIIGDTINFTITATNNGPDNATGIQVTDQLPSGVTFASSTVSQGNYNNSNGLWDVGNVSSGNAATLTITATVDAGTSGQTITNEASVSALNESDPDLSNNAASSGITVVQETTDIGVTKIVDDNQANEGEYINFTINVSNNGPRNATSLNIIDQLPTGLTFEAASPSVGSYNSNTGIWTIGTLANGSTASLALQARVDLGTEGNTITNSAAVNNVDQADNNASNNSTSVDIDIVPAGPPSCTDSPMLSFQNPLLVSGTAGQVGAVYKFSNVTSGVDAEVEIVTISNATLNNIDVTAVGVGSNFQPQVEATDKNQPRGYMDFEVRFKQSGNTNSAFLSFAASGVDVDGDGNQTKEYVGFQRLTSYTVESATNLVVGSESIYTTFEASTAANVTDIDPSNTNNLAYSTYTNEPQFRVRAGVIDPIDNTAQQRYFAFNFDPCLINNFNNPTSTNIVEVGVTKTVDDNNPETGDTINYTVNATNNQGNAVGNVEITDQLPNGLTFVSATPSQGTYNNGSGVWDIGNLSGSQVVNLTIQATVNNNTAGDLITNTASLTNNTGTDGNTSNNTASADIQVFDPNSGLQCTEPAYFSFINPNLEGGVFGNVGAVWRFSNVRSGIDALVKITGKQTATLNELDSNLGNSAANFSPLFTATNGNGGGYIEWEIKFVQAGTLTPVKQNFAMSALDIDGATGGGGSIRDYLSFAQNQSSTVESGTNLNQSLNPPFQRFTSSTTTDAQGSFDTNHLAFIRYLYTSVLNIRTGSVTTGGYTDDRLVDIDFRQCINQEFDNPVVTTRDADIAITKTTDNANPLSGETVNFTITATNNGPENATELDINEAVPAGLTLVTANPSQGNYNQITKIWSIGTLNNGNSATLNLETTVNQGANDNLINKAYVKGLNQFDPVSANDTSKVAIQVSVPIKGIVFEDKTGNALTDGDTNVGDATGDQQARANVSVYLFKDGGDGIANGSDDTYIGTKTTNSTGAYNFQVGENGTYWVAVDSRSNGLSNGITWPEQTYAPSGGLCTDGAGSTTTRGSAGVCFGGRRGDVSDGVTTTPADLANAEHIAKVVMSGSEVNGINFGFSYNVVTDVDDGDDDTGATRTIQGSLRQFIQNANAISGANTMRFVPAVASNASGSGGSWWAITIGSALPTVTDALTTVDGTAFDLANGTTELDTNPGTVGTGGTVGVDQLALNTFARKELDINLNDIGNNAFRINSTGAVNVRDLSLFNNSNTLRISGTSNGIFERNILGSRADGTLDNIPQISNNSIVFDGTAATSVIIRQNYISPNWLDGIRSDNANAVIQINKNEIYNTGGLGAQSDGISGLGTWTIEQNLIHQNGKQNSQSNNGGSGIELGSTTGSTQNNTIRNNTVKDNRIAGITILNGVLSTLITKNIIQGNGTNSTSSPYLGAGVRLTTPASQPQQGIRITNNSFFDNYGVAIDIVKTYSGGNAGESDGVNPNDGALQAASAVPNRGLDYPVFTLATLEGSTLHIEGYIGTFSTHLTGTFNIEIYKAANDGNNDGLIETGGSLVRPHGEGRDLISTITTNPDGTFSEDITVGGSLSIAINDRITALAFNSGNSTSEFSSNQRVVPTGVTVSGYVYHDNNHNGDRTSGEPGIELVTMVLFNEVENNCKSVLTDANGFYQFGNVLNGNYQLIEALGESVPTPDVCTPAPADPADHISTTPNTRSLTINNLPVNQDFGDFEGSRIQGNVFNDNGTGGGTAHDLIRNGGETGIGGTVVRALNSGGTTLDQTNVSAGGTYTLYIAKSQVPSGGTAIIKEVNKNGFISIDANVGITAGTYNRTNDEVTFTNAVGTSYTGVNFADVENSRLLTDGEQNVQPGGSALFTHQFEAKTAGSVIFTSPTVTNPSGNNFPVILYQDTNNNGEIDSGEPVLTNSDAVSVTAGQTVSLVLRVTVPQGTDNGTVSTSTVTASMDFTNTSPLIQQVYTRTDVVNATITNGGLALTKAVDKAQALPGETLTYSITYQNNGSQPLNTLKIEDDVPAYTGFTSASYSMLPNNLTNCTISAPSAGQSGTVTWTFTGTLAPGQTGTVTYKVTIQN